MKMRVEVYTKLTLNCCYGGGREIEFMACNFVVEIYDEMTFAMRFKAK